jgi:hypothetical protein
MPNRTEAQMRNDSLMERNHQALSYSGRAMRKPVRVWENASRSYPYPELRAARFS